MKKFLEYIVKGLVKNPKNVKIEEQKGENEEPVFVIKVTDEDKGLIIGKEGKVIQAIRTIASIKIRKKTAIRVE